MRKIIINSHSEVLTDMPMERGERYKPNIWLFMSCLTALVQTIPFLHKDEALFNAATDVITKYICHPEQVNLHGRQYESVRASKG
jgi:hypothetical protein